jgi:hypothetical protein
MGQQAPVPYVGPGSIVSDTNRLRPVGTTMWRSRTGANALQDPRLDLDHQARTPDRPLRTPLWTEYRPRPGLDGSPRWTRFPSTHQRRERHPQFGSRIGNVVGGTMPAEQVPQIVTGTRLRLCPGDVVTRTCVSPLFWLGHLPIDQEQCASPTFCAHPHNSAIEPTNQKPRNTNHCRPKRTGTRRH